MLSLLGSHHSTLDFHRFSISVSESEGLRKLEKEERRGGCGMGRRVCVCVGRGGGWSYLRSKDVVCNVLLIVSKTADEKGTGLQPCIRS